jgi:hypothetical protein
LAVTIEVPKNRDEEYRAPRDGIRLLQIPPRRFVMVDGSGPPRDEAFQDRMPGLYGTAYGLRFALKRRGVAGRVAPLEGLWWTSDARTDLDRLLWDQVTWRWTLMIALPEEATDEEIQKELETARLKTDPAVADRLRVEWFEEGAVAQIMHIGPYAEERRTIERLHAGIQAARMRPHGRHHGIYLGDPRRAAPERLRTILRQPIEDASPT